MTQNQLEKQKLEIERDKLEEQKADNIRKDKREKKLGYLGIVPKGIQAAASVMSKFNDTTWYSYNKSLVDSSAQFAFGKPLGLKMSEEIQNCIDGVIKPRKKVTPGVMSIRFIPSTGMTTMSSDDAINVAAKNIYQFVRHANSGSKVYEAPDYMMYLIAADSPMILLNWGKRIYSLLSTAKSENWMYPKAFFVAEGLDYDDWSGKQAEIRTFINQQIAKFNSLSIPATFSYYARHTWMVSGIYKDQMVKKSQDYIFTPDYVFKFSSDSNGTALQPVRVSTPGLPLTFDSYKNIVRLIMNALLDIEDVGIMSGDTLKAYGDSGLLKLDDLEENYHVESAYIPEVLTQINATTAIGMSGQDGTYWIRQNTKGHIYQGAAPSIGQGPRFTRINVGEGNDGLKVVATLPGQTKNYTLVNMYKDNVTPDDTMVATRLAAQWEVISRTSGTPEVTDQQQREARAFGTEIVSFIVLVRPKISSDLTAITTIDDYIIMMYHDDMNIAFGEAASIYIDAYRSFDWAPGISMYIGTSTSTTNVLMYESRDLANFIEITRDNLETLHNIALMSEFSVPVYKTEHAQKY